MTDSLYIPLEFWSNPNNCLALPIISSSYIISFLSIQFSYTRKYLNFEISKNMII